MVELETNKNEIIVVEESKAIEIATEEYFKGNTEIKINGTIFDIFKFGNFNFRKKAEMQY